MMRGPTTESRRFVTDASGRQTAVIVPIDAYELLVANVTDLAVAIGDCRCLILGSAAIVPGEHTRFVCKHPETGTAGQRRLIARAVKGHGETPAPCFEEPPLRPLRSCALRGSSGVDWSYTGRKWRATVTLVGAYEAKTQLPRLLERANRGERIIITKHGVPYAALVPVQETAHCDPATAIEALRALRRRLRLDGLSVREMIDEGRA